MTRELSPQQAFQTHCLGQMGITSWLSAPEGALGTVFFSPQPWAITRVENDRVAQVNLEPISAGFSVAQPEPVVKVPPEEKEQSVAHLREQLNAGPEIIVEDLQPIEELAVDIVIEPEVSVSRRVTQLDIRAYALGDKLLILTDVPKVFSQQEEVEQLALNMGQALLKRSFDEWHTSALSWPGGLKNPQFLTRTDWLLGALESYIQRLVKVFPETPKIVLAGSQIAQLVDELPENCEIKHYPTARIVSLPELHRIPELRKEAWEIMQSSLFTSQA